MNVNSSQQISDSVQQCLVAEHAGKIDSFDETTKSGKGLLVSAIGWICLGTILLFILFGLSAPSLSPTGTLLSASLSGAVGVLVSSLCLRALPGFRLFLVAILSAYILRVLVGVVVYQHELDDDYFEGQGTYKNRNWEFRWTYENLLTTADSVLKKGEWRTRKIYATNEDKNAHIHTWMGYFLASGQSRHALDIAPFNAYHHVIAAILVVGLALACGSQQKVALFSGALIAWVPWGFAASIMWRDSVGFAWVVLAIVLLCIGRDYGLWGSFISAFPASFLAWADRSPYLIVIVVIMCLSILYDQQKNISSGAYKIVRFIVMGIFLLSCLYFLSGNITEVAMERHENHLSNLPFRLLILPLQVFRALAGPFPWRLGIDMDVYSLFDYLFHVVQFSVFLIIVNNWRQIVKQISILSYSAAIFWVSAFIAGGVHTAYLAVAFPFALPLALNTGASIWKYLGISSLCFVIANACYILFGLAGSGMVLKITGY